MKKAYIKPGIFMEKFEMSEHIARCSANHPGEGGNGTFDGIVTGVTGGMYETQCKLTIETIFGSMPVFKGDVCGADQWKGESDFGLCYHGNGGDGGLELFGS